MFDLAKCVRSKVVECIFPTSEFTRLTFLPIFWLALPASGFSIRIPLFGLMDLHLPFPISHPFYCTAVRHTQPKNTCASMTDLANVSEITFL